MSRPLLRFNFWLDNYPEYNCGALGNVDWRSRGTSRPVLGALSIAFGLLTIPVYAICAVAMLAMRELSAYKIMLYLAVADSTDLLFASLAFGVMSITGEVYCSNPRFQLLFSLGLEFFFFCSGTGCLILAFNRFGEMLRIRPIIWLFKGSRAYWVLGACTIPVCLLVLFTPLMLFNSTHHMLFFDPMIFDGKFSYESPVHFAFVIFLPTASLTCYVLLLLGLVCRYGSVRELRESQALSKATLPILVQSGAIIAIHMTALMTFQLVQFMPAEAVDAALYLAHVGWMLVHGSPPIVYLALNGTIRKPFDGILWIDTPKLSICPIFT
ncbi:hypothetical protein PRIPAC_95652, partial [Pristionchus pacificus]|uniref:G protein-coupled receptor n=1 Tax=Pristionchus pacificus TaxID=54126 RepID=A0A2A6D2E6_PRIPA